MDADFDSDLDHDSMMAANEANWDARTPIHVASQFYGVQTRDPASWFAPFEWDDLGPLEGRDVAHLQCHIGAETLAFAKRGARTVGLDISGASVEEARRLAAEAGLDVEYVKSNVYGAADALGRGRFDVVYTGKGALLYLPDLPAWAAEVAALLRPGGQLYLVEFHPMFNALGTTPPDDGSEELLVRADFLSGRGPLEVEVETTYTDGPALTSSTTVYEWSHGIGDVVNALVGAGLVISTLREVEKLPWPRWATMTPGADGWFALPPEAPRIPLIFALRAVKP